MTENNCKWNSRESKLRAEKVFASLNKDWWSLPSQLLSTHRFSTLHSPPSLRPVFFISPIGYVSKWPPQPTKLPHSPCANHQPDPQFQTSCDRRMHFIASSGF